MKESIKQVRVFSESVRKKAVKDIETARFRFLEYAGSIMLVSLRFTDRLTSIRDICSQEKN